MADSTCGRLAVERYATGELEGQALREFEAHLASCGSCSSYYARLSKERREFLRVHPFSEMRAIGATVKSGELWYERLLDLFPMPVLRPVLIPACVVLLVAIVIIPFTGRMDLFTIKNDAIRYKGAIEPLSYIYKRKGAIYEQSPQDTFFAGDRIQIFYGSRTEQYCALFSVDAKGTLSFYHPEARSSVCSIRTGVGARLAYPVSIELDSLPGRELVVALFSEKPLDQGTVRQWVASFGQEKIDLSVMERSLKQNLPFGAGPVATLMLEKR
ncbi:MAG: zf-HC2 domain-containing protein [Chitinispirillaceae bacterium]|nr:zf-HC2 domain-containing protein [Chitinispirillaceae bacterium]